MVLSSGKDEEQAEKLKNNKTVNINTENFFKRTPPNNKKYLWISIIMDSRFQVIKLISPENAKEKSNELKYILLYDKRIEQNIL